MNTIPTGAVTANGTEDDIISSLPEDVRCHILSFLPTKKSLSTSVLSRSWRYLWKFVPVIHIHQSHITFNTTFIPFVNQLLLHSDNSIRKIYLDARIADVSTVNSWIQAAVLHKVCELDINFGLDGVFISADMILGLSLCRTLEVLKLHWQTEVPDATAFSFPLLKVLHLTYACPSILERFLGACPILEEFVLNDVLRSSDEGIYNIFVPTLKRLKIRSSRTFCGEFHITTPALESLDILGDDYTYKLANMPLLREANVYLEFFCSDHFTPIVKLLDAMANVVSLCLSHRTLSLLRSVHAASLPKFHNLTHLELQVQVLDEVGCKMVIDLIKTMPKLYSFVLLKEEEWDHGWLSLVKIIEIKGYNEQEDEQVIMNFLNEHTTTQDYFTSEPIMLKR